MTWCWSRVRRENEEVGCALRRKGEEHARESREGTLPVTEQYRALLPQDFLSKDVSDRWYIGGVVYRRHPEIPIEAF
jgi:hypothetical protein